MTRIPSHSPSDAQAASRPLLEERVQFSPAGHLLNMHAQMAHAPVVREAAGDHGRVSIAACQWAASCGWTDGQLAEAFAYSGLTVFTAYFLNYAATEVDLPAGV